MTANIILARANGCGCAALIVNQVVIAEANTTAEIDRLVVNAAHQLRTSLGVPLVECTVDVPEDMDGKWEWVDLIPMLPPVAAEMSEHSLVAYCWQEGGICEDTPDGPGDAWCDLYFDLNPPMPGTPFTVLVPACSSSHAAGKEVVERLMTHFSEWLDGHRARGVSEAFHEIVAKVETLVSLTKVSPELEPQESNGGAVCNARNELDAIVKQRDALLAAAEKFIGSYRTGGPILPGVLEAAIANVRKHADEQHDTQDAESPVLLPIPADILDHVVQALDDIEGAHSADRLIAREAVKSLKSAMAEATTGR